MTTENPTIMNYLSDRINALSESQTIAMARKSRELNAQGIDVISLSLGEPDFYTPDPIKKAAKDAIDNNFSFYTHVSGYLELREAISRKFKRDNDLNYPADQIVVSTGAKQSIANAVLSIVNPGDEVIVPAPYWVSYIEIIKLAEGIPVIIPTTIENDFKVTPEQLRKAISPKSKLIMFSTPCNPTGSVYNKKELRGIADVVAENENLFVICDEIYEHINFKGKHESLAQFEDVYDRVATINGVSKGFAMTGWRVGFLGAPSWLAKACDKMQGQFTSATCSIAQKAAHAAMDLDPSFSKEMNSAFLKRRDLVLSKLKSIPGLKINVPDGAFYVFPEVSAYYGKSFEKYFIKDANDLCMFILEVANVALVPGEAFGAPGYIRISYATSEERLSEAMLRIKNALAKLN